MAELAGTGACGCCGMRAFADRAGAHRPERTDRPVVLPRTFAPVPGTRPLPHARRECHRDRPDRRSDLAIEERLIRRHRQQVRLLVLLQEPPKVGVVPVHRAGRHPPRPHSQFPRPLHHPLGQLRLGGEHRLGRHTRRVTPPSVLGPLLRQVQGPIQQSAPLLACVGQEHAHLGVLDPPGGAGVLADHATRLGPLLEEPGLVHNRHPGRLAQVVVGVASQLIADCVGVPVGAGEEMLHPVRGGLAQVLGQLPAVLPLGAAQEPAEVGNGSVTRLAAGEVPADPLPESLHLLCPPLHISPRRSSGHDSPSPQLLSGDDSCNYGCRTKAASRVSRILHDNRGSRRYNL
jgi:hypothetical protein